MPKYLITVLPPSVISKEIVEMQKEVVSRFGCSHAQKAPPHITVIPPFDCSVEKKTEFVAELIRFLNDKPMVYSIIELDNFQRFESRTLFVDVAKNEAFEGFCKALKLLFNQQKIIKQRAEKHYFVPHITLANKDITKRDFKKAWEIFKDRVYQRGFTLKEISILELKGGVWKLVDSIAAQQ